MKVEWVKQTKTNDPKKALEMSIAKWRFFTYCTKAQFIDYWMKINFGCGLCKLYTNSNGHMECGKCSFYQGPDCNPSFTLANDTAHDLYDDIGTLEAFHVAARKVFEKLKSLR